MTKKEITMGEKNALRSATEYLENQNFSFRGLVEQLEYEGYTHDEAVFGVSNVDVDWNEQAAGSAKSYLESSAFSRTGLKEQLIYEGFSEEQAEYGVTQAGY